MENTKPKRGRPAGSKNVAKKTGGGLQILKLEKQIEGSPITRSSSMGWINWGAHNDYPTQLLNLYNESPTHRAAINFGVQSILGNGVDFDAMGLDGSQTVPNAYESWDSIIKNLATDYLIFGTYYLEIILNRDGKTYSFYHMPADKIRWGEFDDDGLITSYWCCNDWSNTGMNPPFEIDAFDTREEFKIDKGKPYLYGFRQYSPAMVAYSQPHYQAGIKAIQSEIEYVNYDLKHIVNGFTAAGVLTLPEMETDDEKRAIVKNIQSMFTSSDNTNQIAVTFRNNIEEKPVEWTPFTNGNTNVNTYADANERTISRILAAHQIPNASLIGLPDLNGSGFASEADKLEVAYQLYNKLTGNANRMAIIRTLNQMFKMNGIDTEIIMKPLSFNDFGNDANVAERTNSTAPNINENNIEEKVE